MKMLTKAFVCMAAALVVGVAAWTSVASASGGYFFVTTWGSAGSGNGQFNSPRGVAVDAAGNVYVADWNVFTSSGNSRVEKFDSNGNYLTQWGTFGVGAGQFLGPQAVAVDRSSGDVYVTDNEDARVEKFDSNGNFLTMWGSPGSGDGQFNDPIGVAVDQVGNVYVGDGANDRVEKFDSNGNFLTMWGSPGSGDGQFSTVGGVAIDGSGNVYVADHLNDRVEKFDSNGNFLTTWGSHGSGDGQFSFPLGVAVDSSGDVYVTDAGNDRVEKFDSNGNFLTTWGGVGSGDGQFSFLSAYVAVDQAGNVYVTDDLNHRVEKFAPDSVPPTTTIALNPATPNGSNGWYTSPVGVSISATDDSSGVASTRCVLDPVSVPTSFDDLPMTCPYLGSGTNVAGDGQHTVYAASEDNAGNKEAPASASFQIDSTPPTVTCPAPPTFVLGQTGTVTGAASDPTAGSGLATSATPSAPADTSTAGAHTVALSAADNAGNVSTVSCSYQVGYQLLGFFSPLPRQNVNAGSTIAVKFALADNTGTRIPDSQAQAIVAACRAQILFTALQPSPNCFSYDRAGKQFVFNLRTPRGSTGLYSITVEVFSGSALINTATTQINLR